MISLMTPSRGRVPQLTSMILSALATATSHIEFVILADDDDIETQAACDALLIRSVVAPRSIVHSSRWDRCLPLATGDILFHANDDLLFRTPGWDRIIESFFAASGDKLWMVHGDDLGFGGTTSAAHPVVHRRWVDVLGYFIPPYFDGDYPDTWVTDIANRVGRRRFLPYVVEHMHHLLGKGEADANWRERMERQRVQDPGRIYAEREPEREADAGKLRAAMVAAE